MKLYICAIAVLLGIGFLGSLEACSKASRRHAAYVESSASATPIASSSGCVGRQAVAVQLAPVTVTYQVQASSGCQGYQAQGCQSQRVGIFRNGPLQRIHDRRHSVSVQYVPVEPAPQVEGKTAAKCGNPSCQCADCNCAPQCDCDPQTPQPAAQTVKRYRQVCGPNGCYLVEVH